MLTRILLSFLLCLTMTCNAAVVSRIYNFSDGSILTALQLNSEFNNLVNGVNSLDDTNIITNANIDPVKLSSTIAGDGLARNGSTGILSVGVDGVTIETAGDAIQLKDLGITNAKIAEATITGTKLVDGTIGSTKIADGNITSAKLASDSVTTIKILDANVTGAKIAASTILSGNIADGAVTVNRLFSKAPSGTPAAGGNLLISSPSGSQTVTNTTTQVLTGDLVLTAVPRPVKLEIQSSGTSSARIYCGSSTGANCSVQFFRNGTLISTQELGYQAAGTIFSPCSAFSFTDTSPGSAGATVTYSVKLSAPASTSAVIENCAMTAAERL